jgi:hypothetical protein
MTLSFSKSVPMHEACLLLFLHRYNSDRAILLKRATTLPSIRQPYRLASQNNVMFPQRAESRDASVSQDLQSTVQPFAHCLRNDSPVEEGERSESKRFASDFVEVDTR